MADAFWSHFEQRRATWRDGGPRSDLFTSMSESERGAIEARLLSMLGDLFVRANAERGHQPGTD